MVNRLIKIISILTAFAVLISTTAQAAPKLIPQKEYYDIRQEFTTLDISAGANMGFQDEIAGDGKGGWTDQGAINDFRGFTLKGLNKLIGIDFNIIDPEKNNDKSCIVLRGQSNLAFPTSAEIPVNKKCVGVYFLHSAAWAANEVGTYRFIYEDGTESAVPVVNKVNIFDWWGVNSSDAAVAGWTGPNLSTTSVSLYVFACENPQPDKVITKIIAETSGDKAYLMLVAATLTESGPFLPEEPDRGNPGTSNWYPYTYCMNPNITKGTVLDASFLLDAPAGKHGFVKTADGGFVFEDGTEAKFWGTNIVAIASIANNDDIAEMVENLAQKGFNLLRIHAFDANYLSPGIFGSTRNTKTLNKTNMDRFCFLLSELKKRGIYYYLGLNTFWPSFEDDNIHDFNIADISSATKSGLTEAKFFDRDIIEQHKDFAQRFLEYYNPYTGLRIIDDPAMAMIEFNNEASLLGVTVWNSPHYYKQLKDKFNKWLIGNYETRDALLKIWGDEQSGGLQDSEDPLNGTVDIQGYNGRINLGAKRRADSIRFYMEIQSDYMTERVQHLRSIGLKCAITGVTSWGSDLLATLYTNINTDYIDTHNYWSHPSGGQALSPPVALTYNAPVSQLENKQMGILGAISNLSVYGMPHTISEWNSCAPNPYTSDALLLMSSYGGMHGWAPMLFCWDQQGTYAKREADAVSGKEMRIANVFTAVEQPDMLSALPAAAMIFLRDVKEADTGFYTKYQDADFYNPAKQSVSKDFSIGMIGKTGIASEGKLYDPDYNNNDVLYLAKQAEKNKTPYVSVTGEMSTDLQQHLFRLNTERSQAVTGFAKGITVRFDDIDIKLDNEYATVYLNSLSDEPIWDSPRLLLTTIGRTWNSGQVLSKDGTKFLKEGTAPVLIEPVTGEFVLKTKDTLKIYSIDSFGQRVKEISIVTTSEGFSKFRLEQGNNAMNYEVVRVAKYNGDRSSNERVSLGDNEVKDLFVDMEGYEWAKKYIERLALQGIARGTSENTFDPDADITADDFIGMLTRGLGWKPEKSVLNDLAGTVALTESKAAQILAEALKSIGNSKYTNNLLYNYSGGDGSEKLCRVDAAVVIYKLLWE